MLSVSYIFIFAYYSCHFRILLLRVVISHYFHDLPLYIVILYHLIEFFGIHVCYAYFNLFSSFFGNYFVFLIAHEIYACLIWVKWILSLTFVHLILQLNGYLERCRVDKRPLLTTQHLLFEVIFLSFELLSADFFVKRCLLELERGLSILKQICGYFDKATFH